MSLGLSVGDLVSAIGAAVQCANTFREWQLRQEWQQLALTVDGLVEICKPTDLEYVSLLVH